MLKLGVDKFIEQGRKIKVAIITNSTGISQEMEYNFNLLKRRGVDVIRIFSPEQGLFGTYMDGEKIKDDTFNGIPVVSLYGNKSAPDSADLEGIDALLYDMEDAGVRYFTLVSTLKLSLESAKKNGVKFILLDRPNPLNSFDIRGPGIEDGNQSFVGIEDIPIRYGLTPGELALYFNRNINADLEIIKMDDYNPMKFHDEQMKFYIPLSLHLPTMDAVINYQALCLLEATNISVGRGTPSPFVQIGAPFLDGMDIRVDGAFIRKTYFRPVYSLYSGIMIPGFYIHILDRRKYDPFLLVVKVIKYALEKDGFEIENNKIKRLYGSLSILKEIKEGIEANEIIEGWKDNENVFKEKVLNYRLYDS